MKLIVNGKPHVHEGAASISSLLKELKIDGNRVAIMVNDNVVASGERKAISLKDGDRIEFLTFAGGG